jgi:hypothetical protein
MAELVAKPPENCVGPSSEQAGKAAACAGCPNQNICATAPKGPDPGAFLIKSLQEYAIVILLIRFGHYDRTFKWHKA